MDEAPMLYIGEKVGSGKGIEVDIAVDPLEGTTLTAHDAPNAMCVLALSVKGGLLNAPDIYMDKIAVGANLPKNIVDLDETPAKNIIELAKAKNVKPQEITACVLNRSRHNDIIESIRSSGAKLRLISDGDVAGVINTTDPSTGIDIYIGRGGAPEGVLAAAALRCIGGQMQGRLFYESEQEKERTQKFGITDLYKKYTLEEMACQDVMFAATGVTDGNMLSGVRRFGEWVTTETVVMRAATGTIRWIKAKHKR
jgi:fructose-1,6-bisphosphatase II / sedoheptulose-1,7-bisphosphatase